MAKTRSGPGRSPYRQRNNKNSDAHKKNIENGLYVHSSPPQVVNGNQGIGSANIREYIRSADVDALEDVVLSGQGAKLVNQHATDPKVRAFLRIVPSYMSKIDLVHDSVEKGNLRDLKALLDRRKLSRSKDQQGVGLLHKAVLHGHKSIVDYLIADFPETLDVKDNDGRTAHHYCAASKFPDEMYSTISDAITSGQVEDNKGRTPGDYMSNPGELKVPTRKISDKKGSGGSKNSSGSRKRGRARPPKQKTPPKRQGINITSANIRIWIHDQDLPRLEHIVWEGEGHRLLKETSNHTKVRQFLNLVPRMMTKIKEVHQAAVNGDLETLEAKADQPAILNAKDHNGLNALHKAAALGHRTIVEWVLTKAQAPISGRDRKDRTPLHYAAVSKDYPEVYNILVKAGAEENLTDIYGKTAKDYNQKPGDLDISVVLERTTAPRSGGGLDVMGPSRNGSNSNSQQPSRAHSRNGRSKNPSRRNSKDTSNVKKNRRSNKDEVEFHDMKSVLDNEIEQMIKDADLDKLEMVILSGRGADLRGRSSWNETVRRFLKKTPQYMEKISNIHDAAASGKVKTVKQLLAENGKLAMGRGKDGTIALHHAAEAGNKVIVDHLLNNYMKGIHAHDMNGQTPLHYAARSKNSEASEVYDLLVEEGALEQQQDLAGYTAEDYRSDNKTIKGNSRGPSRGSSRGPSRASTPQQSGNHVVAEAIAEAEDKENYSLLTEVIVNGEGESLVGQKSKDPDVQDFLDRVPEQLASIDKLHRAVEQGETRQVVNLLDRKTKALTRDKNFTNILHKAVLNGHTDIVRYLVHSYPDLIHQVDRAGRTPLHYAAVVRDGGHIYKILEKSKANDTIKDNSGHTPSEYLRDPHILTQWDLKKELEDGIPVASHQSGTNSNPRPITKGSEASLAYYGAEDDGMEKVDSKTLARIEAAYASLRAAKKCRSLLRKYLTKDVFEKLKNRQTTSGASLLDVIISGVENLDSSIGVYAPDAEAYTLFKDLFDPIIDEYHGGFGPYDYHPGLNFGSASALGDFNEQGDFVISTRVRCARSIEGYPFNTLLEPEQYSELEQDIEGALDTLEGDLAGYYRPLNRLSVKEQDELIDKHVLFKQGDRFLESAGANRFWPDGRGIFLNSDDTLVVWVNEEDHLRIISMQSGGDLASVYHRFVRAVTGLGNRLPFTSSQRLGFLSFCPTNLGTSIRASVHIQLPHLGEDIRILKDAADHLNLQVRGTHGEHSAANNHVYDISNRRRLGLTEFEALQEMYDGVKEIIRLEIEMGKSKGRGRSRSRSKSHLDTQNHSRNGSRSRSRNGNRSRNGSRIRN